MKRRRFLSSVAILLPTAIASTNFLSSCNQEVNDDTFSAANIALLDEIGETIIPATTTSPGAKAAQIGQFMKVYVPDCYDKNQQQIFWSGIKRIKDISMNNYKNSFSKLSVAQKQSVLKRIENEAQNDVDNKNKTIAGSGDAVQTGKGQQNKTTVNSDAPHFYSMLNELVLFGYFTSKPGASQALRYIQTPGYFQGDVPYKKGDKSWAT